LYSKVDIFQAKPEKCRWKMGYERWKMGYERWKMGDGSLVEASIN
jgi:hypothetical protein